jgi:hypothetical protein
MVIITHAHWQISVPSLFLVSHPQLEQVLTRRKPRAELPPHPDYDGFIRLLEAQGCFTSLERKAAYSLGEARELFDPLRSMWYARYYAHSLWERLRTGTATRNAILAWVIHNYHISRAAGVVGARIAAKAPDPSWRAFFRQDTLEEYWHCDAYYFVRHPELRVDDAAVKTYVPLPSSLAFEAHTLQLAERSPLAHLLVAYFQESSIAFYDDCLAFYRAVEREYGLTGFFGTWQQHMRLDQDHGHAVDLAGLFDTAMSVSATALDAAIAEAWLANWFLCRALDDIEAEALPDGSVRLRPPVAGGRLTPSRSSLEAGYRGGQWPGGSLLGLCKWVIAERPLTSPTVPLVPADEAVVGSALVEAAYESLSRARDHEQILHLGHLCRGLKESGIGGGEAGGFSSPWAVATAALIREAAVHPAENVVLMWVTGSALASAASDKSLGVSTEPWLRKASDMLDTVPVTEAEAGRWLTRVLQLRELLDRWFTRPDRFNPVETAF